MQRKLFVLALVLAGLVAPVRAQPPLTLAWTQSDATPTEAQAFTYRYYLDGQPGQVLQGVTCVLVNTVTECRAPLPAVSIGTHEIGLTGENVYGEGPRSAMLPFRYPAVPGAPTNLRIVRGDS